jgi:transcriptional regulator with XRE-family HTH domain
MRLWWNHIWKSHAYRKASARERRIIEIRYCISQSIKARRRALRWTQQVLASRVGCSRHSISKIERASNRVALEIAVECLIVLGCRDDEIGLIFNAGKNDGIKILRARASESLFPRPRAEDERPTAKREHRFYSRRRNIH